MATVLLAAPVATVLAASQVRDLADRDRDAAGAFALLLALWLVLR